jgi:hypothetical protein
MRPGTSLRRAMETALHARVAKRTVLTKFALIVMLMARVSRSLLPHGDEDDCCCAGSVHRGRGHAAHKRQQQRLGVVGERLSWTSVVRLSQLRRERTTHNKYC